VDHSSPCCHDRPISVRAADQATVQMKAGIRPAPAAEIHLRPPRTGRSWGPAMRIEAPSWWRPRQAAPTGFCFFRGNCQSSRPAAHPKQAQLRLRRRTSPRFQNGPRAHCRDPRRAGQSIPRITAENDGTRKDGSQPAEAIRSAARVDHPEHSNDFFFSRAPKARPFAVASATPGKAHSVGRLQNPRFHT